MTERQVSQPEQYQERAYWNERQDDITIIFLNQDEARAEQAELDSLPELTEIETALKNQELGSL